MKRIFTTKLARALFQDSSVSLPSGHRLGAWLQQQIFNGRQRSVSRKKPDWRSDSGATLGIEMLESRHLLSTLHVTTAADIDDGDTSSIANLIASPGADAAISLREAITATNNTPNSGGPDQILFAIPGTAPFDIAVSTQLPNIFDPVILDATTQPGYVDTPVVSVSSSGVATGLSLTAGSSTVAGLAFEDFTTGISLSSLGGNTITGVDVSWAGATATGTGLSIQNSSNNIVDNISATNRDTAVYLNGTYASNVIQNSNLSGSGSAGIFALNNGSGNHYLNNDLSNSASLGIYIRNDTQFQISGNDLSNTATGVQLASQDSATISAALGPGQLDVDLSQATNGLVLDGVTNSNISGLDLSWSGATATGTGLLIQHSSNNIVDNISAMNRSKAVELNGTYNGNVIQNSNLSGSSYAGIFALNNGSGNHYLNNDLSNSASLGIYIQVDNQFQISGNDLSNSGTGVQLAYQDGATISSAPGPGQLDADVSQATNGLVLAFVTNSTISGVDLSWAGATATGYGLHIQHSSNNTIDGITATNRSNAVRLDGTYAGNVIQNSNLSGSGSAGIFALNNGSGNQYLNNNLSNSGSLGIYIQVDNLFQISGNDLSNTATGVQLAFQDSATISPALGPGQLDVDLSQATNGLVLDGVTNSTISGLDLSWSGAGTLGTGIRVNGGSNSVIESISVENRANGVNFASNATNSSVHCSRIQNNDNGIYVDGTASGIVVNDSIINGNTAYGVLNITPTVVNAESNYWGSPDGPAPIGTGDSISANVDADPFRSSLPPCLIDNTAPQVADQAFNVDENETDVGTVIATDADLPDDTLTYAITGGVDENSFTIDSNTGALTFISAPDYEMPHDQFPVGSPDNVYDIQVTVSDAAGETDTANITVNVLNLASITGEVFVDVNGNNLFDANEPGIDGVVVELLDGGGNPVLDAGSQPITATSSDGGMFMFEDLDPGTYQLHELQPTGVDDGAEFLGSLGGTIVANDTMQLILNRDDASDYNFAEIGQELTSGDTATIGFWHNKHGQALIAAGGTSLATWLTVNFGNVFGNTFTDGVGSDDGAEVASFYKHELFKQKAKKSAGPAKVDAQFMATALATYFTSSNLAGFVAGDYGFNVTDTGIGTNIVNVGNSGAAFGVADGTNLTIMQLLLATNDLTDQPDNETGAAKIYDVNGDGIIDAAEAALRAQANEIYSMINES